MTTQDLLLAPIPKKLSRREGSFAPRERRLIQLSAAEGDARLLIPAARQVLKSGIGREITASPAAPAEQLLAVIRLEAGKQRHEQGYSLQVRPSGIDIKAGTPAGAFYGACTLLQILRQCRDEIPCLTVEDWPDFADRGVMLDISRDKVPSLDTLYHLVDLLAEWKVNHFELYTEHTFAYLAHPTVWAQASPVTGEEILKLDEYCRQRFVQLVPNQNSFGHMNRWLKHDEYRSLAEAPDGFDTEWGHFDEPFSLCPTNPRSIKLIESLYAELLPHFSSRLFNVGCDETWDLGRGRSAGVCKRRGVGRVYLDFLLRIHELVEAHGRTMSFWGDIILNHPELIPELPKDVIALSWGYEADHPFADQCARFREAGLRYNVCPGTSSWNTLVGRTENAAKNIMNAAQNGLAAGAGGLLNTDWGDNGHYQPLAVSYAGYLMGAMASWNSAPDVRKKLGDRLSWCAFQDPTLKMGNAFTQLGDVYRVFRWKPGNSSAPWHILFARGDDSRVAGQIRVSELDSMEQRLREIARLARGERMKCADAPIVRRELDHALKMMHCAVAVGRARLGVKNWDRGRILARDMLINHEHVWLIRNRPGGLQDSLARLRHLV